MNLMNTKYIVVILTLLVGSVVNGWAADHSEPSENKQENMGASLHSMSVPCPPLTQIDESWSPYEIMEYERLQACGVPHPTRPQAVESLRLQAYLHYTSISTSTVALINESLRLQSLGNANPSIDQINESLRLQSLGNANPSIDQIHESLRLQALDVGPTLTPTLAEIEEGLRLAALHGVPPTAAEILASLDQQ
jgi:hypothetical protein